MTASGDGIPERSARRTRERAKLIAILVIAAGLLSIGIGEDFRLRHEDNNALHEVFAANHLGLGVAKTRGHNTFVDADGNRSIYGNHPPGPGLVLAAVIAVVGNHSPLTIRSVAMLFHLVSLLLFYRISLRVMERPDASTATLFFALLPMGAFFGRMVNHETLSLAPSLLVVQGYWSYLNRNRSGWMVPLGAAAWGALMGWMIFFVLGACVAHGAIRFARQRCLRALVAATVLLCIGTTLFVADLAHILWIQQDDGPRLVAVFFSRVGVDADFTFMEWLEQMGEVHLRNFTLTGTIGVIYLATRLLRAPLWVHGSRRVQIEPGEQVAGIFLLAGLAYMGVFAMPAMKHHYWQFPLLPAVAIGTTYLLRRLAFLKQVEELRRPKRLAIGILFGFLCAELFVTSAVTLVQRHTKTDARVVETVRELERRP